MELYRESFSVRWAGRAYGSLVRSWADSLIGRGLTWLWLHLQAALAGSLIFGLGSVRSRSLQEPGGPVTFWAIAAPYRLLYRGSRATLGRVVDQLYFDIARSVVGAAGWLRIAGLVFAGAGLGGLGRLIFIWVTDAQVAATELDAALGWVGLLFLGLVLAWGGAAALGRLGEAPSRPRSVALALRILDLDQPPAATATASSPGWRGHPLAQTLTVGLSLLVGGLAGAAGGIPAVVIIGGAMALGVAAFALFRPEAILLVLAAFPWLDFAARSALGALAPMWDELLLLGALSALLFSVFLAGRVQLRTVPISLPLLVALVAALGSVAMNEVPPGPALFGLRITFQPLIFFYLGYLLPRDRRWIKLAVGVFLAAGLAMALHGLFQFATDAPMPQSWVDRQEQSFGTRAYSIIENPNGLAAFLLLGTLVSASLTLAARRPRHFLLLGLLTLTLTAGVGVTFSRGSWLGLIAGVVAMAVLAYRRFFGALVAGALVAPVFLPAAVVDRLTFAFSSAYINKSLVAGRLLMWNVSMGHIVQNPWFGVGLGTFGGTSAVLWGYGRLWVDNFYLQLGAEGGLILLGAFLWLLFRAAKSLVAAYLYEQDPWLRAFAAGVFGAFVAVAVANLTAGVWETLVVGAGFWFLSGLAAGGCGEPRAIERRIDRQGDV